MSAYAEYSVGYFFTPTNGRAKYVRDYLDQHPGAHPVFSASLAKPFGYIDTYDYEGSYLTWVMNGYGGRTQVLSGKFSITRDRGVLIPVDGIQMPNLSYLRYAIEPELIAAAVGRRVDGRLNEYTKVYPPAVSALSVRVPIDEAGEPDYQEMDRIGNRLARVLKAQQVVARVSQSLRRASFPFPVDAPAASISLGDERFFRLSIGTRVLTTSHLPIGGVPAYSANALVPFGRIEKSNLTNFESPSLLWGIDGTFDWNLIPAGVEFATTDHCGRLQVVDGALDPAYVYAYLKATRRAYGFDRVFRASLRNVSAEVAVEVPLGPDGTPSGERQVLMYTDYAAREAARVSSVGALADLPRARVALA